MFTTPDQVSKQTGYAVTLAELAKAQAIVEVVSGRAEALVTDPNDLALLGRATAFQAVYMQENPRLVYEQAAFRSMSQNDNSAVFQTDLWSPFVAPLAAMAIKKVSWFRSRNVVVGPMTEAPAALGWERE